MIYCKVQKKEVPLIIPFGGGVNSTAMVLGAIQRGIEIDLILFADTGGEKPETYMWLHEFNVWLKEYYEEGDVIYYGFDKNETARIQRRSSILGAQGYKSDYPLALWPNPLTPAYLDEIGIAPPMQYKVFKHANCRGCIKGGQQHWLCVYVHDRKTYDEFAQLEEEIGHTILRDKSLDDLRPYFDSIVKTGIEVTEHIPSAEFWVTVKNELKRKAEYKTSLASFMGSKEEETKPCECLI